MYAPFGLITNYEDSFGGRYYGKKSDVKVVTLQPTVSYAFNEYVSVGIGPTFNKISGNLTSSTPLAQTFGRNDGLVDIKGDDTAWGYKVGILVTPWASTNIGLTYTSRFPTTCRVTPIFPAVVLVRSTAGVLTPS